MTHTLSAGAGCAVEGGLPLAARRGAVLGTPGRQRARALLRPALLTRWPVATPLLALALGALVPQAAALAMAALVPVVVVLVFCAIACVEPGPRDRAEVSRATAVVLTTMLACPVTVVAAAVLAELGPDLACAAVLVAGGPVSMGGGVMAARFGMPSRPMVWASAAGVALVPLTLPAIAGLTGHLSLPPPGALALAAAWLATAPLLLALLARRLLPRQVAAVRADLRGLLVLALAVLACSAGGRTAAALGHPGGWECVAVALGVQCLAILVGWATGAALGLAGAPGSAVRLGPQLALAGSMRNTSIAWAAALAAGGVAPRTEDVVGAFVALIFVVPALAALVVRCRPRASGHSGPSASRASP